MKKATVWLLLATYFSASCAGLIPLVNDAIAHIFWSKEHIEHVHHGKKRSDHVVDEIAYLLHADHSHLATFTEASGSKAGLSAHCFLPIISEACELIPHYFAIFPPFQFILPKGVGSLILLPPEWV